MPDSLSLADLAGDRLSLQEYRTEFSRLQWSIGGQESWKLERGQHFRESGFASWEAFARGDWGEALRLIEGERAFLTEFSAKAKEHSIDLYRLRVVEQPIDPYLQWELHLLKLRSECGELIRVATTDMIRDYETVGPLPELVTLGTSTLYHVLYDDTGELSGAVRITRSHCQSVGYMAYAPQDQAYRIQRRELGPVSGPNSRRYRNSGWGCRRGGVDGQELADSSSRTRRRTQSTSPADSFTRPGKPFQP